MVPALIVLAVWCVLSVPAGVIGGRIMRRASRHYPMADGSCTYCGGVGCKACDARELTR